MIRSRPCRYLAGLLVGDRNDSCTGSADGGVQQGPREEVTALFTRRTAGVLAWSLWAVFVATQAVVIGLIVLTPAPSGEEFGVAMIGFATVGALVASRRPANSVGWLLLAVALTFAVGAFAEVYVVDESRPGRLGVAWVGGWAWYVWVVLVAVFLPLLFPDGRVPSPRWRPVWWLGSAALVLSVAGAGFAPGRLDLETPIANPLAASGPLATAVEVADVAGNIMSAVAFLLAAVSVMHRFRRSQGVERQQLKWFALCGLFLIAGLLLALFGVVVPGGWRDVAGSIGWFTFLAASILGLPVAVGVAILRHRLYDVDVVIKRTLVYGALTAALAGTYLVSVLVLRLLLSPVTGESDLAVAASTLAVAGLFRPLRDGIQRVVDRRFFRARYDAARTLEGFASRVRDELDLDALGSDLRGVVRATMQPAHVSLWLRGTP